MRNLLKEKRPILKNLKFFVKNLLKKNMNQLVKNLIQRLLRLRKYQSNQSVDQCGPRKFQKCMKILNFFIFFVDEPSSLQEATTSDAWRSTMQREYDALIKNRIWRLVDPPIGIKPIGCKWVYKNKYKVGGSLDKHKARLLAKGYAQRESVDYTKTFAPTAKWGTI